MLREYDDSANAGLIAICLVNIDHFQRANREEGRGYGDKILQEFARCLKASFSENDCLGRLEADEFIVVLDHQPDKESILKKAALINEAARKVTINGENAGLTASIGVAIAPYNGKTYNHLFHAADLALYDAKEHGRGSCQLADE
jgi:diguanylate cyclase (GGDEF)-like protein